jgi:FkbM family methyltransferase
VAFRPAVGYFNAAQRRSLTATYIGIRSRAVLAHRLGFGRRPCRILNHRFHYLNEGWFQVIFDEVFLNEIYYFHAAQKRPFIVDCGSNIGLTVLYFKLLYPESRILAFEPQADAFAKLQQNVAVNNFEGVDLVNAAVGSNSSRVTLYWDPDAPGDLGATTLKDIARLRKRPLSETSVPMVRLSEYLKEDVEMLKLDTEGAELEILREIKPWLPNVRQIFIEFHHHPSRFVASYLEVMNILDEGGFFMLTAADITPPLFRAREQYHTLYLYAYRP